MHDRSVKIRKRDLLVKPVISIIILAAITISGFQFFHQKWIKTLSEKIEIQHRQNITQIVHVAYNIITPVLNDYRAGAISRGEALERIRRLVRKMTYRDQYGNNYVFMSLYDGTMLVQPYEPQKELTSQWDLQDSNGLYIIRELVKAAMDKPEGSFVKYYYFLPNVHSPQEKLAYVIGIPELRCYIGTGMYMQMAVHEQKEIMGRVKSASIWFFIAILIPLSASMIFILNRNRLLLNEIASREDAENELRKSEEKYRSIFENIPEGIFQTSPTGKFLSANLSLARMFGYDSPEELMENTTDIGEQYYVNADDRRRYIELMRKNGQVDKYIIKFRKKDGTYFWASNNSRAAKDANGEIIYFEGAIDDITALVEAEARARQSEEKFSKIFMTSPEGIVITLLVDGRFIDVNPGFEKITGWTKDEITGKTSIDIGFWDNPESRSGMYDELKKGGSILYREFLFRTKDKVLRNGIYSARSITIAEEECLVFVMHDITDIKVLEEEQRKLEQQLFQSQKMEAIGKLAGGVAHDFNNILTGIQGLVSLLLLKTHGDETSGARLLKIEEQVKRGASLTKQLLNLAREGSNEKTVISINDLINKSTELFRETRKGIGISITTDDETLQAEADPAQLEQVLLNLYINADHAMPDGGTISIHTSGVTISSADARSFDSEPGDYVKITVSDTGTGMDRETLKRIFDPFFTTKADSGGTGLGLASAYAIIRNHGGRINAYSEPGHGTIFTIYIPSTSKGAEKISTLPEKKIFYGSGTILLVDDEQSILESVSEMLNILGYTVYRAPSGQDAINIYKTKSGEIRLVILDMIMPGMSGSQVLKILREIDPGVKVILSSGYILQGESLKVIEYEYSSFMQKPYSMIDLSRIVHDALSSA